MTRVAVIGATSWGVTLGISMARNGHEVWLWTRTADEAGELEQAREHRRFLPGLPFPPGLRVSADPEQAMNGASVVMVAVPSRSMRANARRILPFISTGSVLVSGAKGLERGSGKRMSQVLGEELLERPHVPVCALSGPNLSREIAEGKPASTVVACPDIQAAELAQRVIMSSTFRVYTNQDIVGVELGGALKNIFALGAGICDGLGYGVNAKSAFINRGLVELTRLGVAAGANPLTIAGLAGLGDLIATAFSPLSRNRWTGEQLAHGRSLEEILASTPHVVEGVETTPAALSLAEQHQVEMPITEATHRVLFEGLEPLKVGRELMGRTPSPEWWGVGDVVTG